MPRRHAKRPPDYYFRSLVQNRKKSDRKRVGLSRYVVCPGSFAPAMEAHALEVTEKDGELPEKKKDGSNAQVYKRRHVICRRCGLTGMLYGDGYITPEPIFALDEEKMRDVLLGVDALMQALKQKWTAEV